MRKLIQVGMAINGKDRIEITSGPSEDMAACALTKIEASLGDALGCWWRLPLPAHPNMSVKRGGPATA